MLTMFAKLPSARHTGALVITATAMLTAAPSAQAGGIAVDDCIVGRGGISCVHTWHYGSSNPYIIKVPQPQTDEEIADAKERDKLWRNHCRPVVRQDMYGVSRYTYAAPGCEYGKFE